MSKYKAAVIGMGNIGLKYDLDPKRKRPSSHAYAYEDSDDFQLVCGIDPKKETAKYLYEVSPNAVYCTDLEKAINEGIMSNVDVVSVCTQPDSHLPIINKLIENKVSKVIFCEKPIVSCIEEAKDLRDSLKRNGQVVVPNISRRWNSGLRNVTDIVRQEKYGKLKKINIRYTRGIYNTGSHLFDLLAMWTGSKIESVFSLDKTTTTADPEPSYSFWFKQLDGVTGYAEAVDDSEYYLFEIDLYFSKGKIEIRNSGDDIYEYAVGEHHLFSGFNELIEVKHHNNVLDDLCLKNAINNISDYLCKNGDLKCCVEDAIYPIYVAEALENSYQSGEKELVKYE